MSNILKIKQFPEVEKCKVIQHLKNEIRIIGDEFKTNNITGLGLTLKNFESGISLIFLL